MTQDQSRAEFEAWARGESPSINLTREGDGYRYSLAEMLYGAWQAARAAAPALPPTLNDAMRAVLINEHDVYQTPEALYEALLAAHRGCEEPTNQAETRMDTGVDRGCEVLPEVVEKALHWIDCDTREHVRDCIARNSDPNDIYGSLDQLERILRAAPSAQAGWMPIESAPKDGTPLLAFWATAEIEPNERNWGLTAFVDFEWRNLDDYEMCFNQPTHWMPLPQPPKEQR